MHRGAAHTRVSRGAEGFGVLRRVGSAPSPWVALAPPARMTRCACAAGVVFCRTSQIFFLCKEKAPRAQAPPPARGLARSRRASPSGSPAAAAPLASSGGGGGEEPPSPAPGWPLACLSAAASCRGGEIMFCVTAAPLSGRTTSLALVLLAFEGLSWQASSELRVRIQVDMHFVFRALHGPWVPLKIFTWQRPKLVLKTRAAGGGSWHPLIVPSRPMSVCFYSLPGANTPPPASVDLSFSPCA